MTEDQETLEKLILLCNKEEAHLKVIIGCSPKTLCIIPIDAPVVQKYTTLIDAIHIDSVVKISIKPRPGYATDTSGTPRNYGEGDGAMTDSVLEPRHPEPHIFGPLFGFDASAASRCCRCTGQGLGNGREDTGQPYQHS